MHKNPFSPSFSAVPGTFFGRGELLDGMREALDNMASPYRLLFVMGTRGSGKSSLLHELASLAAKEQWFVIETHAANIDSDIRSAFGVGRSSTHAASLKPSVSLGGVGSVSLGEVSRTKRVGEDDKLATVITGKTRSLRRYNGVFIAIDEVQGADKEAVKQLCVAMQASRSQGLPLVVVMCGLPGSHHRISRWRDCTFIIRMHVVKLGVLTAAETLDFMTSMFAHVPEIGLDAGQIESLASFAQGQPYLMHLTGYHLYGVVEEAYRPDVGVVVRPGGDDVAEACRRAFDVYRTQILASVFSSTRKMTRAYIEAVAGRVLAGEDTDGEAILAQIGCPASSAKRVTQQVLRTQIVDIDTDGAVFFTIPYFAELFNDRRGARKPAFPKTRQLLFQDPAPPS